MQMRIARWKLFFEVPYNCWSLLFTPAFEEAVCAFFLWVV